MAVRYIAVFTLFTVPVAKGFATKDEAVNCLEQACTDSDSLPLGMYDAETATTSVHQCEDRGSVFVDEGVIVRLAKSYIDHFYNV